MKAAFGRRFLFSHPLPRPKTPAIALKALKIKVFALPNFRAYSYICTRLYGKGVPVG